jgi:hypothetical protein
MDLTLELLILPKKVIEKKNLSLTWRIGSVGRAYMLCNYKSHSQAIIYHILF